MTLKEVLNKITNHFVYKIEFHQKESFPCSHVFKTSGHNLFVAINELHDANHCEIRFFRSDKALEKIHDDYLDVGISFYPKTLKDLEKILDCLDA